MTYTLARFFWTFRSNIDIKRPPNWIKKGFVLAKYHFILRGLFPLMFDKYFLDIQLLCFLCLCLLMKIKKFTVYEIYKLTQFKA